MNDFVTVSVALPASKLGLLYSSLAGIMGASAAVALPGNVGANLVAGSPSPSPASSTQPSQAETGAAPVEGATAQAGEKDAAGTVFDPARHTGTKVKSGLWRMKTGMARGPGEGEDSPSYVNPNVGSATGGASSGSPTPSPAASTTAPAVDEDDEFAAFRTATASTQQSRSWQDADLSKLCNQAAIAAGDPAKVKEIIAKYVPVGQPQHSRSIPAEQRETFARDVEATLGIKYEG